MNQHVYLYVFDTMADWEAPYICAELNSGRYFKKGLSPLKVITVGLNKTPVITMGGIKIMPELALPECDMQNTAALILPGGNTWLDAMHRPIIEMAEKLLGEGLLVAAICGATMALANAGILDRRKHTSNNLDYLKMICPNYMGESLYQEASAVTDGSLITASGLAPVEFAAHILQELNVFTPQTLDAWYQLYKTQEAKYFMALMNSLQ